MLTRLSASSSKPSEKQPILFFLRQPLRKYVHQKPSDDIPVWANVEFRSQKKMFYKCRDKQRKHLCDDNRLAMIRARSEYKSTCKNQRRGYETKQTKKLLHAQTE